VTVVVAAMFIVDVMVTMVVRGMIMCTVIMGPMGVHTNPSSVAGGVGAALGIERRFDFHDTRAEALDHVLDDVIPPDPQALADDLGRQMTIAEMPGQADQMKRILPTDFKQWLRCRNHLDQSPIFQNQRIAAAQRYRCFEIKQELKTARSRHHHPPPVTVVEIQHHGVGPRLRPMMLSLNLRCADHLTALAA